MASDRLDPRRNAYRDDLADVRLEGKVEAARFVGGERRRVARAAVALRRGPDPTLGFDTELLFGEAVSRFDEADGWAWVQAERDGYVGYVPADALDDQLAPITHRVSAIGTFLYGSPEIKSPPLMHLSINTPLTVAGGGRYDGLLKDLGAPEAIPAVGCAIHTERVKAVMT